MDPLVGWGLRAAAGAFALLGLVYFALWMDRGGVETAAASALLLAGAAAAAFAGRKETT